MRRTGTEQFGGPRRRVRWATFAGAAAAGLLLGSVAFEPLAARVAPQHFALEAVSVVGAHRVSAGELLGASGVAAGTSVLTLDPAAVSERVASHPWIVDARATTLLPRKLLVAVVEREPAAIVEIGAPPTAWLVDDTGTPFAPAAGVDAELYPTIVGASNAKPQQPDPLLAQGVHLARAVVERGLPAARRVLVGGTDSSALPELRLGPLERRVVLGGGDLEGKLERLSWILGADLPEAGTASTIDLRFGDRVILRNGASPSGDAATGARGGAGPSEKGRAG